MVGVEYFLILKVWVGVILIKVWKCEGLSFDLNCVFIVVLQ